MSNTLDLCGGAGGATIGLHQTGLFDRVIAYDNWLPAVRTHHMNGLECIHASIKGYEWERWGVVDLIWASPPCQPFSQATIHNIGQMDPRDCIPDWIAAVKFYRPRVTILENVSKLGSPKHAGYVKVIVKALRKMHYKVSWRVLNCADYGVPQARKRFFLIARRDGKCVWPKPTHAERHVSMATALEIPKVDVRSIQWVYKRPATTVVASFYPEIISPPAYRPAGGASRQGKPHQRVSIEATPYTGTVALPEGFKDRKKEKFPVIVSVGQGAILQGFPQTFHFYGPVSHQRTQVGNAVPPVMPYRLAWANREK